MHMPSTKLGMMLLAAVLTTVLGLVFAGVVVSMATTSGEQFMQLCEVASRGLNDLVPLLYVAGLLITVGAIFFGIGRGLKTGMAAVALAVTVGAGLFAVQPPQTASAAPSCIYVDGTTNMNDDALLRYGNDGDIATVLRSTILAADAEVTNLIVGTSNHPGVAANSYILSNVTQDGDVMVLVNNGGNSIATELVDASAGQTEFNPAQADWNLVVKTQNNAQTLAVDGATDSVRIGGNNIADTGSLLVYAKSSIGSSGSPSHSWWTSSTTTIPEAGAYAATYGAYIGQTTWTGTAGGVGETITDASTVYILGAPIQGADMTVSNLWALLVEAGTSGFGGNIVPQANDGSALGTTALGWSDLHLATGGVINWANGGATITETDANTLTIAGISTLSLGQATTISTTAGNLTVSPASSIGFGASAASSHYFSIAPTFSSPATAFRGIFVGGTWTTFAGSSDAYIVAIVPTSLTTAAAADVYSRIATMRITEPVITLGGGSSVTETVTLFVQNAATEGTRNYAIHSDDGTNRFDGTVSLGFAGTTLGVLEFNGNTSGTITMKGLAAAGTWNFVLPPDDGDAGEQLQTDGAGNTTWEAAASLREYKNILGSHSAQDALAKLRGVGVYDFTYRTDAQTSTGDYSTVYTGIMADEAPWAMHHNGRIFNPVSAFGYSVLAIQATNERIDALESANATLKSRLDALEARVNAASN